MVADGSPFPQDQRTRRFDAGLVSSFPVSFGKVPLRASGVTQKHQPRFGALREDDRHDTAFAEPLTYVATAPVQAATVMSSDSGYDSSLGGGAVAQAPAAGGFPQARTGTS